MSSPPVSPGYRRPLEDITNLAPLSPDPSPVKKRKFVHSVPDEVVSIQQGSIRSLPLRRMMYQFGGGLSEQLERDSFPEAMSFCSSSTDFERLSDYLDKPVPFCLTPLHHTNRVAVGLQGGDIAFLDPGHESSLDGRKLKPRAVIRNAHANAVLSVAASASDKYMATTGGDQIIQLFDIQQGKVLQKFSTYAGRIIKMHPNHDSLAIVGSRMGNIHLYDFRLPSDQKIALSVNCFADKTSEPEYGSGEISNAHDSRRKVGERTRIPKSNKKSKSITALTWCADYVAASACESNSCIRGWDFRQVKRTLSESFAFETTAPQSHSRTRHFGVCSLEFDPTQRKIWSLCRDNHIYSYGLSNVSEVADDLTNSQMDVSSFYPDLTIIGPSAFNSGSYIACGGGRDGSIPLFTKPGIQRAHKGPNTYGQSVSLMGHNETVSVVAWHSYSGRLISISDDSTVRFWAASTSRSRSFRAETTPLAGWANEIEHP